MQITHIVIVILNGLSCEVEHGSRYNALTNKMADFKVGSQNCLRVLVLEKDGIILSSAFTSYPLNYKGNHN